MEFLKNEGYKILLYPVEKIVDLYKRHLHRIPVETIPAIPLSAGEEGTRNFISMYPGATAFLPIDITREVIIKKFDAVIFKSGIKLKSFKTSRKTDFNAFAEN